MTKPTLYSMCGIPGSGKSFYAKRHMNKDDNIVYVSRDVIRYGLLDREDEYFSKENLVYKKFIDEIVLNLSYGMDVIADATHLNWASRHKLLAAIGDAFEYNVIPVVVSVDLGIAFERNNRRTGLEQVPKSVIRRMSYQFTDPATDPYEYTTIKYVYNKEEKK